jgi:hypothetical protein
MTQLFLDRCGAQPAAAAPQPLQHRLNPGLALPRCQIENLHVLLGRTLRLLGQQGVICPAKPAAREQIIPVAIVGEGARLTHQPVDDVPIVDAMLASAPQPRQPFHQTLGVPNLDVVGMDPGLDPFADQPAGHRVGVALHVDGAATIHAHPHALARLQTLRRQGPQHRQLLGQPRRPTLVALREQLPQKRRVRRAAGKIAAAAQHQRLVQRPLELVMTLLHVAVLVRLVRVDRLALHVVMPQQSLITPLKRVAVAARRHGGR